MAIAFLMLSVVFGALHLGASLVASRFEFLAEPRPPDEAITASIAIEASKIVERHLLGPPGEPIAAIPVQHLVTRATIIEINYLTPIDVNNTADISARLSQEEVDEQFGPLGPEHRQFDLNHRWDIYHPIERLDWPIILRLDGPGLEWTEHDIAIKKGTPLAVTEHWVPRAKNAGEYVMRFPLRDINHAGTGSGFRSGSNKVQVIVNEVESKVGGSDDVTLPLSIWTHGIPARWFDLLTLIAAIVTGLGTILTGAFGAAWGTGFLKRMRKRSR
jgi:hypothetical protein